jgi:hypothetical protein
MTGQFRREKIFVQGPNENLSLEMGGTRKGGKHTPQKPVPPKPIPVTPASKSIPVTSEAASGSNTPTMASGASSSSLPPAITDQGPGPNASASTAGNSVTFTASTSVATSTSVTPPTTSVLSSTRPTPTTSASSSARPPGIPVAIDKLRDLRTSCNTSITATYDWLSKVNNEMKALIGCSKTDQRLTELLGLAAGVEAAMDYHTQERRSTCSSREGC